MQKRVCQNEFTFSNGKFCGKYGFPSFASLINFITILFIIYYAYGGFPKNGKMGREIKNSSHSEKGLCRETLQELPK